MSYVLIVSGDQNLAAGLDVYLVFKHDETAAGALEAEQLLQAA